MDKQGLSHIGEIIAGMVLSHAEGIDAGADMVEKKFHPALRALEKQFYAALEDKLVVMPTALQLAIVNVLGLLPAPAANKPEWADRPDHDTARGVPMKAGT